MPQDRDSAGSAPGDAGDGAPAPPRVVLVTGPSGAGRSTAIAALEDLGFEAIDNMPLSLLPRLLSGPPLTRDLALGVDIRNRDFTPEGLLALVASLDRQAGLSCTLLYLDCDPAVLERRFSETRRRHPLAADGPAAEGIAREIAQIAALRDRADVIIDSSAFSPHDLRAEIARWFAGQGTAAMTLVLQSFSYRRGIPPGADMVLDCRFLRNPHWDAALRPLDGRDAQVARHIRDDPLLAPFLRQMQALLDLLLPAHAASGKACFTLALGCTGGQHRSVFVAESLAKTLAERGWRVSIRHRELDPTAPVAGRASDVRQD